MTQHRGPDADRQASELLPWYVNGTLDEGGRRLVEEQLAVDEALAADLEIELLLQRQVQEQPVLPLAPHPTRLSRLMERVETGRPRTAALRQLEGLVRWWFRPRAAALPVGIWALVWVQALLTLTLGLIALGYGRWSVTEGQFEPRYQTLSSSSEAASGQRFANREGLFRIYLAFEDTATANDIRHLLARLGASIVEGPSEVGVYVVALPRSVLSQSPPDPETARGVDPETALSIETWVGALRQSSLVRFAEPLEER